MNEPASGAGRGSDGVEDAAGILHALGYPLRLRIVLCLMARERTGGELSRALIVNQALIARHVRVLRDAGVLHRHRVGTRVYFTVAPPVYGLLAEVATLARDPRRPMSR